MIQTIFGNQPTRLTAPLFSVRKQAPAQQNPSRTADVFAPRFGALPVDIKALAEQTEVKASERSNAEKTVHEYRLESKNYISYWDVIPQILKIKDIPANTFLQDSLRTSMGPNRSYVYTWRTEKANLETLIPNTWVSTIPVQEGAHNNRAYKEFTVVSDNKLDRFIAEQVQEDLGMDLATRHFYRLQTSEREDGKFVNVWQCSDKPLDLNALARGMEVTGFGNGISGRRNYKIISDDYLEQADASKIQINGGYHPQGYGFFQFHSGKNQDGKYVTTWSRSASCD